MHEMQTIVTDDRGVCQSVGMSVCTCVIGRRGRSILAGFSTCSLVLLRLTLVQIVYGFVTSLVYWL